MNNFNISEYKFSKNFKKDRKINNIFSSKNLILKRGNVGLKVLSPGVLTSEHFSNLYDYLNKNFKKSCFFWITKYPNFFISGKAVGVRMGKGKGKSYDCGYYIKRGTILVELNTNNMNYYEVKQILKNYIIKLPLKIKIIEKKI